MTRYIINVLIFAFFFCLLMPIRYFLFASLTYKFYKGRIFYARRLRNNQEVVRIVMDLFLKKHNKDSIGSDWNNPWPKSKKFESKLMDFFQKSFRIHLPKNAITPESSLVDFITYVSKAPTLLKLSEDVELEDESIRKNKTIYRKTKPWYLYLLNFILNIPSDYYRARYPKFSLRNSK